MSEWALDIGGVVKTFEDWGIGDVRLVRNSQAADEFSFSSDEDFDAQELFPYGATIKIFRDAVQYFVGRMQLPSREGTGGSEGIVYTALGPWVYLEQHIFQQHWKVAQNLADPNSPLIDNYRSHLLLNKSVTGADMTIGEQIKAAVDYAVESETLLGNPAPMQLAALETLPAYKVVVDDVVDLQCAEVVVKQMRWVPDGATYFDYATTPPTLHVKRRAQMAEASLSVEDDDADQLNIVARHDLLRPGVVLKFERTHTNNDLAWTEVVVDKAPVDVNERQYGVMISTINLQGQAASTTEAKIETALIAATAEDDAARLAWWKQKVPWLRDQSIAEVEILRPGVVRETPEGETAHPRELIEGQVADWMGFESRQETIKAKISFKTLDGQGVVIGSKAEELATVNLTTTTGTSGTYSSTSVSTEAEVVPIGLAAELYTALSVLHWDGSIKIVRDECDGGITPGMVLNLTGGRAEWATMKALVQTVVENLDTAETTVTFGPPNHLGLQDIIELLRVNRNRLILTSPGARSGGRGGSGKVTLARETARENTSSGSGTFKILVINSGDKRIILDPSMMEGVADMQPRLEDVCVNGLIMKRWGLYSEPFTPAGTTPQPATP